MVTFYKPALPQEHKLDRPITTRICPETNEVREKQWFFFLKYNKRKADIIKQKKKSGWCEIMKFVKTVSEAITDILTNAIFMSNEDKRKTHSSIKKGISVQKVFP